MGIHLDTWIKDAGRSNVLRDSGIGWVRLSGLPLHLRSADLVRCLGDACGGFLAMAEGSDLSSIRVKVRLRGDISSAIPV
ncbi:hypothetical protein LINPERPRIM_LOCUS11594 [Linum perenne]